VDGALYIRGYNDPQSRWYQAAVKQRSGQIITGGKSIKILLEPIEGPLNERIDEAYRAKYVNGQYLRPMIGAKARQATAKIVPIDKRR